MHRLALVALIGACGARPAVTPVAATKPKLVVLIVVDQWPVWAFERDRHLFTGGFARLLRDGAYAKVELPFAATFTAPGHATIATGVTPSVHGVIGNDWYRRDEQATRAADYDPASPALIVGPPEGGETEVTHVSSAMLRVDGIADHLRGRGKSVAIAFKSRSAVFVIGRHPDLAIWYDPGAGGMTSSTAYASDTPPWLHALAKAKPVSRFLVATWKPLDAALLARETKIADDSPGEASEHNLGRAFPHRLALSEGPTRSLGLTPFADQVVLETAEAAIDGMDLGAETTDLLAISLGAHDFAGHAWGPDSWEELDLTLRLDASLGKFFAKLDARYGAGGYSVVLTSDHGATPMIERSGIAGARRITPTEIEKATGATKLVGHDLYLPPGADRDAAAAAASAVPNIWRAVRSDAACASKEPVDVLICASIDPERSGEIYVVPERGSIITEYAKGTHHDSPSDDNRFVPLLVMGAHVEMPSSILGIAPLVEKLLAR